MRCIICYEARNSNRPGKAVHTGTGTDQKVKSVPVPHQKLLDIPIASTKTLKTATGISRTSIPKRRVQIVRLLYLLHTQRRILIRHSKRLMPHLALDIERATTGGQLSSRHIAATIMR